jgi:hypothetical protein
MLPIRLLPKPRRDLFCKVHLVKLSRIPTSAALVAILLFCGGTRAEGSIAPVIPKFRNATLAWYSDSLNSSLSDAFLQQFIQHLKSTGYDGITFQETVDVDVNGNVLDTIQTTRMWQMVDFARQSGLGVALQVNWSTGNNIALDANDTPSTFSIPTFLKGAATFFASLAPTAQAHGITMLYVGYHCDNLVAQAYQPQWTAIIASIRGSYTGNLSYIGWYWDISPGFSLSDAFRNIGIWGLVDAIGVEVHAVFPTTPITDTTQIQAGFFNRSNSQSNVVSDLISLSRQYSRPVIFGSLFFMDLDNALDGGSDPTAAQAQQNPLPLNPSAQAAAYLGCLEVINKNLNSVVAGINFSLYEPWEYQTFAAGPSLSASDAAQLNAFKSTSALAGPTTDLPGTQAETLVAQYLSKPWGYHTTSVTTGGPGNDIIYETSGNNTINSGGGSDEIHGGSGVDTVVIPGASSTYAITRTGPSTISIAQDNKGPNVVVATDVSVLQFDDTSVKTSSIGGGVTSAPVFTSQPISAAVTGGTVALTAQASNAAMYQWYLNGILIADAGSQTLAITNPVTAAGTYTCIATNSAGDTTSAGASVSTTASADPGRLVNLSCRAQVGTGGNILIVGFASGGQGVSGNEPLLIRGSGPALIPFNVTGTLPDPQLKLFSGPTLLDSNSGWGGSSAIISAASVVGAFAWTSASSSDSALVEDLSPGSYTVQIAGATGDTGVALAEVYDATTKGAYTIESPRLVNLSARVLVGKSGGILIAGFVIGGSTSKTVLIRASGPALVPFGVSGTLPDPQLTLSNASGTIATSSGWGADPQISSAAASVGAFSWGSASTLDSAILVTLPPGNYTAQVAGASGDTGVALVEVYDLQ